MLTPRTLHCAAVVFVFWMTGGWSAAARAQPTDLIHQPYLLDTGLIARSISFENPTGAPGAGGQQASRLGPGRKGAPARSVKPGEEVQLCDIQGPGTIRHIWLTTVQEPVNQRAMIIRVWWDDQAHPSIECPIGDFFGFAHGKIMPYQSAVHSVGSTGGRNIWLPMPFATRAKIVFINEGQQEVPLFYQIDYTLGDPHRSDVGRLHVLFRRENPTTEKQDFELLPLRKNKGRFIGSVMGIRNLHPDQWWGEGEIKVYMDGDTDFPTICGTGSEDYVGLAWGIQQTPFLYNGCSLDQKDNDSGKGFVSMYRWHLPDLIAWRQEARITIQQIAWKEGLAETQDDWSAATFWYEPLPSAPLPGLPDVAARTADVWPGK
ncbi:MAG: glycoside hydrolase family 172 protein [Pirellulaceae bacterium]